MERNAAGSFGDQREDHEATVAVRELLAGGELRGEAVEHGEELLGLCQLAHGDGHQIVGGVVLDVLVDVVTDTRSMGQEVLDGDGIVDQWQVAAKDRAAGVDSSSVPSTIRLTTASAVIPFTALATANCVSIVLANAEPAMGKAVRLCEFDLVAAIDAHHAGERRLRGNSIDLLLQ